MKATIAAVQMDIRLGDLPHNTRIMQEKMHAAADLGADIVVFPECSLSGYCFESLDEAKQHALAADNEFSRSLISTAAELDLFAVFGFVELENDLVYNSLALAGPNGERAGYRKVHLPCLGLDRFTQSSDQGFAVHEINIRGEAMRLGMNICYDCSFPESARVLSLAGADVILLPTNWPAAAHATAKIIPPARALENHVYYVAVNRIGHERDFQFLGFSQICDPEGEPLALAEHDREAILVAEIDTDIARNKSVVRIPGEYELHRMGDRQTQWYGKIVD